MTSIRVSAEGRERAFPLGSTVRIGRAADADVVLNSPAVSPQHARLFSDAGTWRLAAEDGSDVWVAGQRITTIVLGDAMSAWLGPRGEVTIHFELTTAGQGTPPRTTGVPHDTAPHDTAPHDTAPQTTGPQGAGLPRPGVPQPRGTQPFGDYHATTPLGRPGSAAQPPASRPPASPEHASQDQEPAAPPPSPPPVTSPPPVPPQPGGQLAARPARPAPPVLTGPPVAAPGLGGQTITGQERLPVLVTRLAGVQRVFPVGMPVRVGRDPEVELISLNPLVSRQVHGLITSDLTGAVYADQSRRGTFLNGKKLRGPLHITESVVLRLGDPATGEELGITPPLPSAQIEHNRGQRVLRGRLRAVAAAVLALIVGGSLAGYFLSDSRSATPAAASRASSPPLSGGTTTAVLQHAEASTVRLLLGSQSDYTGWGSGTVISATGLILTNAHVAEPQAPGAAVALGLPSSQLDPNPPYLTVEVTTGPASPVRARYRARTVSVDGYLDLAVVQIYATSSGAPVNPASLRLPYLKVGSDSAVQLDQPVTVLGFPGVADSDSITVTSGVISTFIPDPLKHASDPRFMLETTARLAHGNSGGAAINNVGELIGVPSLEVTGEGGDLSWRLRAVAEASGLIKAASDHTAYHSHILKQLTGAEQVTGTGVGTSGGEACSGTQSIAATDSATFGVSYEGVEKGLDLAVLVQLPNGSAVQVPTGGLPQGTATATAGCLAVRVSAAALGVSVLPTGIYHIQLYGGPSLTPIGSPGSVAVKALASP